MPVVLRQSILLVTAFCWGKIGVDCELFSSRCLMWTFFNSPPLLNRKWGKRLKRRYALTNVISGARKSWVWLSSLKWTLKPVTRSSLREIIYFRRIVLAQRSLILSLPALWRNWPKSTFAVFGNYMSHLAIWREFIDTLARWSRFLIRKSSGCRN